MLNLLTRQIASRQIIGNLFKTDQTASKLTSSLVQSTKYSDFTSIGSSANRKDRRRFYKSVSVTETDQKSYEINLDKRKLKSPSGKPFNVKSELLANMCAFEWESQRESIRLGTMHLTSLVNTCLDNPNKLTKEGLIDGLLEYLPTDTILFFDNEGGNEQADKLVQLQEEKWRPIVTWFNHKFPDMNLKVTHDIGSALMSESFDLEKSNSFKKYMNENFELSSLIAFNYISESLKSVILTVALLERFLPSVEEACKLTNIEQEHQYDQWGKVEWYHEVNETELHARVSSALCMIYLSEDSKFFLHKSVESV